MQKSTKIYLAGQILLVLGSILYVIELLMGETWPFTLVILSVYAVSLLVMLSSRIVRRQEHRALLKNRPAA